ncbi:MAG: hypothetical protein RLZZ466_765 [Bacteroidota bacterium]
MQFRKNCVRNNPNCENNEPKKTLSGGDRIRTGVQTYPLKVFYMFIPELIVGVKQEPDEPISLVVTIDLSKQRDYSFEKRLITATCIVC